VTERGRLGQPDGCFRRVLVAQLHDGRCNGRDQVVVARRQDFGDGSSAVVEPASRGIPCVTDCVELGADVAQARLQPLWPGDPARRVQRKISSGRPAWAGPRRQGRPQPARASCGTSVAPGVVAQFDYTNRVGASRCRTACCRANTSTSPRLW
jgi:hypothetical protein